MNVFVSYTLVNDLHRSSTSFIRFFIYRFIKVQEYIPHQADYHSVGGNII
jgi:hypothetical protein